MTEFDYVGGIKMNLLLAKYKQFGFLYIVKRILRKVMNTRIKQFDTIRKYFVGKVGLEIGGPSKAFENNGYIPIYTIIKRIDDVNFSDATIWTGNIDLEKGFIANKHRRGAVSGKIYIADATDLSCLPNEAYDFILSSNNIEHLANPMQAICEWMKKLRTNGALVIVAPRKEVNFDHKRNIVKFDHLLDDYIQKTTEHDLTHLSEILALHDLSMDPWAGTFAQFEQRCLDNYKNRCLHHHVFDLDVIGSMCRYFNLKVILEEQKDNDYIIVAEKMK